MNVSDFLENHFLHFNARETLDAAKAYKHHTANGGKMLVAMAGAMSTAELGRSLAEMIRQDQVHAISCTAANLEEDVFNLVGNSGYRVVPEYRDLSPQQEVELRDQGMNRVTDTCIPETVIRHIEDNLVRVCEQATREQRRLYPYEFYFQLFEEGALDKDFDIPTSDSWLYAAWQRKIPIYTPGFEDSTIGNIFTARVIEKRIPSHSVFRSGTEQLEELVNWYRATDQQAPIGFFQIGGGIAGDFAICAVPLIIQDLEEDRRLWQYFAQISDSTTSYGSYSGAVPNEKITWVKLSETTPRFMINSDASIVAPLIFAYVLGW